MSDALVFILPYLFVGILAVLAVYLVGWLLSISLGELFVWGMFFLGGYVTGRVQ